MTSTLRVNADKLLHMYFLTRYIYIYRCFLVFCIAIMRTIGEIAAILVSVLFCSFLSTKWSLGYNWLCMGKWLGPTTIGFEWQKLYLEKKKEEAAIDFMKIILSRIEKEMWFTEAIGNDIIITMHSKAKKKNEDQISFEQKKHITA